MNSEKINIAVIVSGIDEEYQNMILQGIQEFAAEKKINVSNFIAFGGILKSKKYDIGEFNIYQLVNYEKFDGVILLTNTISSPEITREICTKVVAAGIPAVSIDNDLCGFYHIGIDNFAAMKEMTEHIVKHHGIRRINYISGPDDNPESILRINAFREVLRENGIEADERRIFHGFFRGQDGRAAINEFINSDLEFPEAIICANDAMALSATIELEKHGKRVPEDVIVTGFDYIYNAKNYAPGITSVKRPLRMSGYMACKTIYESINGKNPDRSIILKTEGIYSESCGCVNPEICDISQFKKSNYRILENYNINIPMINRMSCDLEEALSLKDNIETLKNFIREIKCEKFYLCMCEDWDESFSTLTDEGNINVEDTLSYGYTENMNVLIAYENGEFKEHQTFTSSEMLPDIYKPSEKGNIYYFVPIHFREICLGYAVICNSSFPMESAMFHTWTMNISNSLENIRKIIRLDKMVKQLDKLYVIDPLTQIYNRNGFKKKTEDVYQICIQQQKPVLIMFMDMDGLKYINDRFGHNEGDFALKHIAASLRSACTKVNQVYARFGGDEFIIFQDDGTEADAIKIAEAIQNYLKKCNLESGKPYNVEASIGYYIDVPNDELPLMKLITIADQEMYENKQRRKEESLAAGIKGFFR
ncbi:MAG: GGDEF domain-containing protein [Porcipelethomonas sp.]